MTLAPGTRIGPYDVLAPLGAGGMGEVYRARDSRLGRDVALKVLPDSFAMDAERVARFRREAQVLAALNHPHIAAIHGLEEADGRQALVLELVEGPTLADRLSQGRMPIDEALSNAQQIAEALEAAHEQGIVHRDLKPANIKITPDGVVKVLDFGLAKPLPSGDRGVRLQPDLTASPTITSPAMMTGVGTILGTAAYMAPEQAKGRAADKRSDVWAFGCVLYEMLTGRRAFEGDDVSDTLAAVLRGEPDWTLVPATTPARIVRLLRACLQKDRKQRVPDIAVARFEIGDALKDPAPERDDRDVASHGGMRGRERLAWACVALLVVAGVAASLYVARASAVPGAPRIEFTIDPPAGSIFSALGTVSAYPTVSPDGRRIVFAVAGPGGVPQLAVRTLASAEVRTLAAAEIYTSPFWSPDSRAIAFFAGGQLKRIDVADGTAQTVCAAIDAAGGTWNQDGTILFTNPTGALVRVAATGGEPTPVTTLDESEKETSHRAPWFLPDGRCFLYLAQPSNIVFLGSLDSAERTALFRSDSKVVYAAATGHLLFIRGVTLVAQPFDAARGEMSGDVFRVADNVASLRGRAAFSVSDTSLLVYWTGLDDVSQPSWFDRAGTSLGATGDGGRYRQVVLAPDGTKAALTRIDESGQTDTWVLDLTRGISTRFTFESSNDPVWSPDARSLAFVRQRVDGSQQRIYRKSVDGGQEVLVWEGSEPRFTESWSPDGRLIAYATGRTVGVVPLAGEAKEMVWLDTAFQKDETHFSPDGQWIAYQSNEAGQTDVYVEAFPGPGQKIRVSTSGGGAPRWRADGRELFYLTPTGMLMAVSVTPGQRLEAGVPRPLSRCPSRTSHSISINTMSPETGSGFSCWRQPPMHARRPSRWSRTGRLGCRTSEVRLA